VEFKSQVGPSFGNNFNNRTEEALGSATDIWAAYRESAFKPSARPFLGYFMLLEDCERSRRPVKVIEPHFPVFAEFKEASYRDRYTIMIEKLLRDRVYDSACFLLSDAASAAIGSYTEPHPELTFTKFVTPLVARGRRDLLAKRALRPSFGGHDACFAYRARGNRSSSVGR
jgi:Restriction endonuclease XhoI